MLQVGDSSKASGLLSTLRKYHPEDTELWKREIYCYLAVEQVDKAMLCADDALAHATVDGGLLVSAAKAYQKGGRFKEAEEVLRKALEREPKNVRALNSIGWLMLKLRRYDQATTFFETIITLDKRDPRVAIGLATCHGAANRLDEALRVLELHPAPTDPHWHFSKAETHARLGQVAEARAHARLFKNLISREPGRHQAIARKWHQLEGEVLIAERKLEAALSVILEGSLTSGARERLVYQLLSKAREEGKCQELISITESRLEGAPQSASAGRMLKELIDATYSPQERGDVIAEKCQKFQKNPVLLTAFGTYLQEEGRIGDAEACYKKAYELSPDLPDVWQPLARILRSVGQYDEAIELLSAGLKRSPNDIYAKCELGLCYRYSKDLERARQIFRDVLDINPNNIVALDQIAGIYRELGDFEEALRAFNKKLEIYPDDVQALHGMGKTYVEKAEISKAKECFDRLLERDPHDTEALLNLARAHIAEDNIQEAESILQRVNPDDLVRDQKNHLDLQSRVSRLTAQLQSRQSEIERSRRLALLGQMASGVAHELNQPIGIIRTIAQAAALDLKDNLLDISTLPDRFAQIDQQAARMHEIITHLRVFARGGKEEYQPIEVNDVVRQTVAMFGEQLAQRSIALSTELSSRALVILGNKVQLEEVLINLLTNARDAVEGRPGAYVRISTSFYRPKRNVCIFVRDNGPGIPQEIKEQIFVPFVSTKPSELGTGIGLYITREIVRKMHGQIYFDSGHEGTTFKVYLPVHKLVQEGRRDKSETIDR